MEKSAIVTGSSRGIGFAIAKQLCVDGYNVVMVATGPKEKNADAVAALEKLGTKIHYVQANIADHDDRLRIVDEALKAFGRIDAMSLTSLQQTGSVSGQWGRFSGCSKM